MANPPPPNSTATGWQVTSQQETTDAGPTGQYGPGVRVSFTTDRGVAGSVFVTRAMYTPENVRAAIADYVSRLHGVQDLRG